MFIRLRFSFQPNDAITPVLMLLSPNAQLEAVEGRQDGVLSLGEASEWAAAALD